MNRTLKLALASAAFATMLSASAAEVELQEKPAYDGAVGYAPVSLALFSPVALPWGMGNWDVFGLDLGIIYADVAKMYGLQVGIANTCRDDVRGFAAGGLFNYASRDVYGIRAALGANVCRGDLKGADFGGIGYHADIWGADVELIGTIQDNICGFAAGVLGNYTDNESYGLTIGGGANIADIAYGCQIAGLYNQAKELHGCQIGLVNYARECVWGFQIGLVNIIMDNTIKVLPLINFYF